MSAQIFDTVGIAEVWIGAGGTSEGAILQWACCVALAESGGDSGAISPSADYGMWQINQIHFGDGIIDSGNWSNPTVNAREAIRLSNNGQNWAAWCTAWANPQGNCGHGYLHTPQPGSPAYTRIWAVQNALSSAGKLTGTTTAGAPSSTSGRAALTSTWASITDYASHGAPNQYTTMDQLRRAIDRSQQHQL